MRIVFCGTGWLPIVDAIRARVPADVVIRDPSTPVAEAIGDADVVLPSNGRVGATEIAAATKLRLIQQPAAGYDGVDLEAAEARGIPVCNAPGTNGDSLAELALFLMLGVARRAEGARASMAAPRIGVPLGRELCGKTLCTAGRGRSATRLAKVAEAMGMTVRSFGSDATEAERLAAFDGANVLSVHCPLNEATRGMIDDAAIAALAPGAILVNAARAPIVDRDALTAALESGHLFGAGLDVFWREPWDPDDPLLRRDDVVTTPHLGGSTEEAFARIADVVAENVRRLVAGEPLRFRVV